MRNLTLQALARSVVEPIFSLLNPAVFSPDSSLYVWTTLGATSYECSHPFPFGLVYGLTDLAICCTKLGSHVICQDKALIYEEAPEAYKSLDSVLQALLQANLIEPVARLKPLLLIKPREGLAHDYVATNSIEI